VRPLQVTYQKRPENILDADVFATSTRGRRTAHPDGRPEGARHPSEPEVGSRGARGGTRSRGVLPPTGLTTSPARRTGAHRPAPAGTGVLAGSVPGPGKENSNVSIAILAGGPSGGPPFFLYIPGKHHILRLAGAEPHRMLRFRPLSAHGYRPGMKLKRLELSDSSLFTIRTTFDSRRPQRHLGPNGCGKSNIVDAVRGPRRACPLLPPSKALEDVIFAGSDAAGSARDGGSDPHLRERRRERTSGVRVVRRDLGHRRPFRHGESEFLHPPDAVPPQGHRGAVPRHGRRARRATPSCSRGRSARS